MARTFNDIPNTPTSVDYPNGELIDETTPGSNDGTPVNRDVYGDIIQFFQKLLIDAGITADGNPDNVTNGYQLIEAMDKLQGQNRKLTIDIGDWNMQTTANLFITHGLGGLWNNVRCLGGIIRNDANDTYYPIGSLGDVILTVDSGIIKINSTQIKLTRTAAGQFNAAAFSTTSYNRGWLVFEYTTLVG